MTFSCAQALAPALPLQVSPHRLISLHRSQSPVCLNQQYMLALVPPLDLLCPDTMAVQWDIMLLPHHHQGQLPNLAHMVANLMLYVHKTWLFIFHTLYYTAILVTCLSPPPPLPFFFLTQKLTGLLHLLVSSLVRNSQLMLLFIPVHLGM